MKYLYNYTFQELNALLTKKNLVKFRITQIIDGLYKSKAFKFEDISTLPKKIKAVLVSEYNFFSLVCREKLKSNSSKTSKYLFQLEDGNYLETVAIPNAKGQFTLCVSTQAGCSLACAFCASGLSDFTRNLHVYEIIEQIMYIKKTGINISNIVFMGIGEPFLNYDNSIKAIKIINDHNLIKMGARNITISTSGIIEGIQKLTQFDLQVGLSISLHFPDNKLRMKYMPVNKKYPLDQLIKELKKYQAKIDRYITIEYILFKDINDNIDSADKLINLLKGLKYKVNLIPYNEVKELDFKIPDQHRIDNFYNYLVNKKIKVTLRKRLGEDINAACGQLRLKKNGIL